MRIIDLSKVNMEPSQGHTSKGNQPKWQLDGEWYKADYMGYEALAEVLISKLLEKSNVSDFVKYEPVQIVNEGKTLNGCKSQNFRGKDEMLIPFERMHRAYHGKGLAKELTHMETDTEKIQYTVNFIEEVTGLEAVGAYITTLLEVDCFFLNEDRHTNNLAVIRNENTGVYRLCPIFDNGLSILSDLNDYPLETDIYTSISRIKAKPFNTDFDEQVSAAEQLYGTQTRFSFTKQDVTNELTKLSDAYGDEILNRTERIIFEQMRKYPVYFQQK
jgi:hypothetical protein